MTAYVKSDKTYVDAYAVYRRGLLEQQKVWMSEKIGPALLARFNVNDGDTLQVLAFGSGFGDVDVLLLEVLQKQLSMTDFKVLYTVVERNEEFLSSFKERVKEHAQSLSNVKFEWILETCEDFLASEKYKAHTYHLIHFMHVLYYVNVEKVLRQCMEKLLAPNGCILTVVQSEHNFYSGNCKKYQGKIKHGFQSFNLVTGEDLESYAKKNNWKFQLLVGDRKMDITDVLTPKSVEGTLLIDFFFHAKNLMETLDESACAEIIEYFREHSFKENINGNDRSFVQSDEALGIFYKS